MVHILAVYGSPRNKGNTSLLLKEAVRGARDSGAEVTEIFLKNMKMSPCLEIYGCKKDGRCVIEDDFQEVYDQILACNGIILASPIFFYTVSAHTKILMDRCQSFWVKKHWINKIPTGTKVYDKKGLFISVGATKGKKLFDGALLSVKYFLDALNTELWGKLLYRGLDFEGDVEKHPEYIEEAHATGKKFCLAVRAGME